jgi:hypothetical protein
MKRNLKRKLVLNRETLRALEHPKLKTATVGALAVQASNNTCETCINSSNRCSIEICNC